MISRAWFLLHVARNRSMFYAFPCRRLDELAASIALFGSK